MSQISKIVSTLCVCLSALFLIIGCASTDSGIGETVPSPTPTSAHDANESDSDTAQPAEPTAEDHSNTLRWSTASEVDNFGFDVYRSDSEDGEFERLTETPVLGAGTSDLPSKYQYVDATIDPHREYFYYVESISMGGVRERFTPVIRAKPKVETADDGDSTP